MNVKDRILKLRADKGQTQEEFAAFIGATKSQVAQWERGHNYPKIETLVKIAQICHVTTDWILIDDESMAPDTGDDDPPYRHKTGKDEEIERLKKRIQELEGLQAAAGSLVVKGVEEFMLEHFARLEQTSIEALRRDLDQKILAAIGR